MNLPSCARAAVAAFAAVAALGATAAAQHGFRGWDELHDPDWRFDPDSHEFRAFQVAGAAPVRDLIEKWESLRKEGAVLPALRPLQELIDDHAGSALQVARDRYVGAAEWARWLIRSAPDELRVAYSKLAAQNGGDALRRARADRDAFALRTVARRFANSVVGQEALLSLAELHRERGAREVAAFHARRLLDFVSAPLPGEEARSAALAARARALVAVVAGGGAALAAELGDDQGSGDGATVAIGGTPRRLADFLAAQPPAAAPSPDVWSTFGGDGSRARLAVPPVRTLDLARCFDLEVENLRWSDRRSPLHDMIHSPIQPIRVGDRLFINNTLSVRCYDLLARSQLWEYEGLQAQVKGRDEDGFLAVDDFMPHSNHDDPTSSKALIAGMTAGQGVVLANLQIPLIYNVKNYQGFKINDPCPIRGLVALDAESGALLWEQRPLVKNRLTGAHDRPENRRRGDPDSVLPRLDVPAPPALQDDIAFVLGHYFEGAVNTYVAAVDLKSGEPWWVVPLAAGQQELSMFNMPFQEFTLGSPAFADGTLFCSTNVGLVAAVDATFGDLRWVKEYVTLPIHEPRNYFRNLPRTVVWHNRGALAGTGADGDAVALFTPHDSRVLLALDPATGKERFSRSFLTQESTFPTAQLIGVAANRAFVAVAGKVLGLELATGRIAWGWPDADGGGRGLPRGVDLRSTAAIVGDALWLPLLDEIVVLSLDGKELARQPWARDEPRNLLVFPDLLVAAGQTSVRVAFDPEQALRELRSQLVRGETLDLLTRIGSLERQAGRLEQAAATLARALCLDLRAAPADLARARAARAATLRELADQHRLEGNDVGRERALVEAEEVADDAQTRVDVVGELLSGPARDPKDGRALRWLERARTDFGDARVMVPELAAHSIALSIWSGFELARRHEARAELEAALAELQRLQADQANEALAEGDSAALAAERVESLFRRAPPALRERYDAEAETAFAAAAQGGDVERLALLLRRFPGASAAPAYAAKELELLRAVKRPVEALVIGAELLRGPVGGELARAATIELARAARDLGNVALASTLVARLVAEAAAAATLPTDLAALAPVMPTLELAAGRLELAKTFEVAANSWLLGGTERPLRGEPLPAGFDGVLLFEQGFDYVVSRIDLPSGDERWRQPLRRASKNGHALVFVHAAGVLVVRRGSTLSGIDLETGAERWTQELERDAPEVAATAGMLLLTQRTPPSQGDEGEPVELFLIEPRSGQLIASVVVAGTDSRPGQLVGAAGCALVTSFGRRGQTVEVFDAVTGARRLEPKAAPVGIAAPLLMPQQQLLVVPDTRPAAGEAVARKGGELRVVGWRLDQDSKAFEVDLLPLQFKLRATYVVAEGLGLLGGAGANAGVLVVDPGSGSPMGDLAPIPPDVADSFRRILVSGEESMVRVQGYVDWRKGGPVTLQLLAGSGTPLWRAELEVPKNTVQLILPDRMLRRGGALLVPVQYHAGGKSRTDLVLLDQTHGTLLAREVVEGGRPAQRDDLVRSGEWVAIRQEQTVRVLGWR